ncbi:histone H2A deubiquitinase MYSM1-like, partial [Tropilaelaps mercedesae]
MCIDTNNGSEGYDNASSNYNSLRTEAPPLVDQLSRTDSRWRPPRTCRLRTFSLVCLLSHSKTAVMAAEDNVDIEGDFSLDSKYDCSRALSENSAILQNEFKPLWTSPGAGKSAGTQRNKIERVPAEDTTSSHFGTSFLNTPSPREQWTRSEEEALTRLLRENGEQWDKISKHFNRTVAEVKTQAKRLLLTDSFRSPVQEDQDETPEQLNTKQCPPSARPAQVREVVQKSFARLNARGQRLRRGNPVAALSFENVPYSSKRPTKKRLLDAGEVVTLTFDPEASDEEIQIGDDEVPLMAVTAEASADVQSSTEGPANSEKVAGHSIKKAERLVPVNDKSFKKRRTSPSNVELVATSSGQEASRNATAMTELKLDPYKILPFEEEANAEYFSGKSGQKTPERYLRIRNHIIGLWMKQRPKYLNKTSSRIGLKNCGDVNCIGLIHDYLERIGAINFGCRQPNAKKERSMLGPPPRTKIPRPRRKVNTHQSFVSQADIERGGCTMEHDSVTGEVISTTLITPQENSANEKPTRQSQTINPFKLVHCLEYEADSQPLNVELSVSALLVAESHSHQSLSEVIGLLGGIVQEEGVVRIIAAIPTRTTGSSGTECEMDP